MTPDQPQPPDRDSPQRDDDDAPQGDAFDSRADSDADTPPTPEIVEPSPPYIHLPEPLAAGRATSPIAASHASASGSGMASKPPRRTPMPEDDSIAPKGLILAWCLYLLATGVVTWLLDTMGRPREAMFYLDLTPPAIRWMLLSGVTGMLTLWPVLRLSAMTTPSRSVRRRYPDADHPQVGPLLILMDWAALNAVFQIAIFLLWLHPQWAHVQSLWVNAAVLVWSLLAGLIVALGRLSVRPLMRTLAMLVLVLLLVGEPLLLMLLNLGSEGGAVMWPMHVSPIQAVWSMTEPARDWRGGPWPSIVVCVGIAAVLGWTMLLVYQWRAAHQAAHTAHGPGSRRYPTSA